MLLQSHFKLQCPFTIVKSKTYRLYQNFCYLLIVSVVINGPHRGCRGLDEALQGVICPTGPGTGQAGLPHPRIPHHHTLDVLILTPLLQRPVHHGQPI